MTDADAIERAVRQVPGVSGMHAGPFGTAATFTAQRRVWGIRLDDVTIDVHLTALPRTDLRVVAAGVRDAVRRAAPDYAGNICIHIEDLVEPPSDAHRTKPAPGRTQ